MSQSEDTKTVLRTRVRLDIAIVLAALPLLSVPAVAQKHASRAEKERSASLPAMIWRNPGNISKLNLFYGEGGRRDAPDSHAHFTFVKEDLHGTNPKFDVRDERGRIWRVKLGQEARPETAATRLLWAAGYFVPEDYFVPVLKVDGLPKLRRGRKFVSAGGVVHGARLQLRRNDIRKLGEWDWFHNSFDGTQKLNGLRVMMCLIDNWDLKNDNNSIFRVGAEREYMVTDLGASFGKTGNYFKRSKGVPVDYSRAPFVARVSFDRVDFVMHSRPFFAWKIKRRDYRERARIESIARDIPVADARWLGHLLAALSPQQLRECFRAAGYSTQDADAYVRVVQRRIAELNGLHPVELQSGASRVDVAPGGASKNRARDK